MRIYTATGQNEDMYVTLRKIRTGVIAALLTLAVGCSSVQYSALEKVGIHKRDILVDNVEEARDSQAETREQLVTAYEELSTLIGFDGGELEAQYKRLSREVERSQDSIDELDGHLSDIDRVSEDLFEEWQAELEQYNSAALKADQARKLKLSRKQFATMRDRMQTARDRVDPVMAVLNDNVLYLKHSLNAKALDALRGQASLLEGQVDALIRDMQIAIDEADAFIANMRES